MGTATRVAHSYNCGRQPHASIDMQCSHLEMALNILAMRDTSIAPLGPNQLGLCNQEIGSTQSNNKVIKVVI